MRISHPNLIYFQNKDLRGSLQRPGQDHLHHHLGHCHCLHQLHFIFWHNDIIVKELCSSLRLFLHKYM